MKMTHPVLLLVVFATIFITWQMQSDTLPLEPNNGPNMVNQQLAYYMEDINIRQFDATGKEQYRVRGKKLLKPEMGEQAEIENPKVQLNQAENQWQLLAEHGLINLDTKFITLSKDVSVSNQEIALVTNQLDLNVTDQSMHSDHRVTVHGSSWLLTGRGFDTNLIDGMLHMHAEVKIRYDAPKQP